MGLNSVAATRLRSDAFGNLRLILDTFGSQTAPVDDSRISFNGNSAFDLAAGTDVVDISRQGIQRHARNVGVGLDFRFQRAGRVTDRGVRHAHSPIQPRPASETPNDRD